MVNFEGVDPGSIADGYGGISGWVMSGHVAANDFGEGVGNAYFYGLQAKLSFDNGPVIFQGAFYKSYASDPTASIPGFSLFYQNQLVYQALDPHYLLSLEWLPSGYSGWVDKIMIHGGGEGYAIDDLTYSAAPVPVPSAVWLFQWFGRFDASSAAQPDTLKVLRHCRRSLIAQFGKDNYIHSPRVQLMSASDSGLFKRQVISTKLFW